MVYSKISDKVLEKAVELTSGLLRQFQDEMDVAYLNSDGNTGLTVSLSVKFSAGKNDTMGIDAGINFVESRIKDGNSAYVDSRQEELPLETETPERTTYLWQEHIGCDATGQAFVYYRDYSKYPMQRFK